MPPPSRPAPGEPPAPGVVLRLPAEAGRPVRIALGDLGGALTAVADVAAVAFTDDPAEAAVLAHALAGVGAEDVGGFATIVPVVDALKRVDGDLVLETVDRSALTRAVAPAIVRADVLRAATRDLADEPGTVVHPVALVGRTHLILPLPR